MPKQKATKTKSNNACWDKVYVISGEPQLCKMALEEVLNKLHNPGVIKYQANDKVEHIKSALNSFSLTNIPDVILINSPKSDMLKSCQEMIMMGFKATGLIIYNPGDSLDGRFAFSQAANKNKRIYHYDFIEKNNISSLTQYIKDWESGTGVFMTDDARKYLIHNAPTTLGKVKTNFGKKDAEVFDLMTLENELDKPYILHQNENSKISVTDIQELCNFNQGYDIWKFISAIINNNLEQAFQELDLILSGQDIKTALALLLSQLKFIIGLKSLGNKTLSLNENEIAAQLSLTPYLNHYLNNQWQDNDKSYDAPVINPWRIKKACESIENWNLDTLCQQYTVTAYAYKDLRFGISEDILIPYLMLALTGKIKYTEPMTS